MQASPGSLSLPEDLARRLCVGVLAGGQSARMGEDKAWLDFGGQALLLHVLQRLAPLAVPTMVAAGAAGHQVPKPAPEVQLVRDRIAGEGPLLGIEALFAAMPKERDLLLLASCDAPFVDAGLAAVLYAQLGTAEAAVPSQQGQLHGLLALYRRSTASALAATLRSGRRSVHAWLQRLSWIEVDASILKAAGLDPQLLLNINEPDEYQQARTRLEGS
ncbi:MAG: hypothetical protein CSA62_08070 [Planctomycetota bacterium]|nr:MAG: hypothetical protein CSA62_08070 [Planctomycetota bacterium]